MAKLEAAQRRQRELGHEAAALRREQEQAMELEAMRREEDYLKRMRTGLARRGLLGREAQDGGLIDEDQELGTDQSAPLQLAMPSVQHALSLRVAPLTCPTPDLSTREVIQWGGSAGLRLVLKHNLMRVSVSNSRSRSVVM